MAIKLPTFYRGAGIIFTAIDSAGTNRVLLGKRLWKPYRGHWTVPGGAMEPIDGGNFRRTAAREVFEETVGISRLDFLRERLLDRLITAEETRIHVAFVFDFRVFNVRLSTIPNLLVWPNHLHWGNEFEQFDWFKLGSLPRPLHPGLTPALAHATSTA